MTGQRGRPKGSGDPAYEGVIELATARLAQPDGPVSATEAVREAIEALAIDLAGVTPTPFAPLVPTEAEIERNAGRKLTLRKRASAPYTLASDDSLVEYLARRIARASAGPASAAHRGD